MLHFSDKRCAFRVKGRASGTTINGSTSGNAIKTSTCTRLELSYYLVFFCKSLDLWLMSPVVSTTYSIVFTHTLFSCQTLDSCLPFLSVAHSYWSTAQGHAVARTLLTATAILPAMALQHAAKMILFRLSLDDKDDVIS